MNRKEAEEFNKKLKMFLEMQAIKLNLEKSVAYNLVDKYIEIYPSDTSIVGMIELKDKGSFSVKPGNILIDQRGLLKAIFELLFSFQIPQNTLNYIQLSLFTFIAIYESVKIDLDENESYIIAYLHSHNMYEYGDEEHIFYTNFSDWYKRQTGDEISIKKLEKSLKNLLDLKSIEIENGEIKLKEKVWHNNIK